MLDLPLASSGHGRSDGLTRVNPAKDNRQGRDPARQHETPLPRLGPPRPRPPSEGSLPPGARPGAKRRLPGRRGGGWRAPLGGHPLCPLRAAALQAPQLFPSPIPHRSEPGHPAPPATPQPGASRFPRGLPLLPPGCPIGVPGLALGALGGPASPSLRGLPWRGPPAAGGAASRRQGAAGRLCGTPARREL